jgi:hypothetical protein
MTQPPQSGLVQCPGRSIYRDNTGRAGCGSPPRALSAFTGTGVTPRFDGIAAGADGGATVEPLTIWRVPGLIDLTELAY